MRDRAHTVALMAALVALLCTATCAARLNLGDPIEGLRRDQLDQFRKGGLVFEREFTPQTGLGPLFNANACAECHEKPVRGGTGDEIETHAAAFFPDTSLCDPLVEDGGPVIQQRTTPALKAALGIDREPVPRDATAVGMRTTPDIFGFGLLDAVPDETILALADPEDRDGDGISGRPNRSVDGRLGRFGRKAFVPTLQEFTDGAFIAEQGITNPSVPTEETIGGEAIPAGVDPVPEPEIDQQALHLTDAFVRFLAPPAPGKLASRGRKIFSQIGCDKCHVPELRTGENAVKALRNKTVAAYTDLLLHDMGSELADICLGLATPSEFRTEPLMGLRLSHTFMHDGRARSIEEAIRLHGGEGSASRKRFDSLPYKDRKALLEFLSGL